MWKTRIQGSRVWKTGGIVENTESGGKRGDFFFSCYFIFRNKTFAWKKKEKKNRF